MTSAEHFKRVMAGDITPRVVCHDKHPHPSEWMYVAWLPTWQGPARPEYQSALADLNDKLRDPTFLTVIP
jgi:hypothetical protein